MERTRPLVSAALVVGILVGFGATLMLSNRQSAAAGFLDPENQEVIREGQTLYAVHCAACHGADLEGQPNWRQRKADGRLPAPPHDETGHTWHHADSLLLRITLDGPQTVAGPGYASDMPAYRGVLSNEQVIAILSYIKSTWPANIRDHHDAINARSQQ